METGQRNAVLVALAAALLFGAGTPAAKPLLEQSTPWLLAGLLYSGSGLGLLAFRVLARRELFPRMPASEWGWLAGAIVCGGIVAPILLMQGLANMSASGASLLLNAEGVFTALLAWFVFRENFDRRIALGMVAIVLGAVAVGWQGEARVEGGAALMVVAACFCWGIDNNLTRKVSLTDASFIAMVKGLVSGGMNVTLALWLARDAWPAPGVVASALAIGFVSYGASLTLFVMALRGLGTARAAAYFSTAPFAGAVFALVFLGEPVTLPLVVGGVLMAVGVWLHVTERHEHDHTHEPMEHEHEHVHDEHHQHEHDPPVAPGTRHRHVHAHERLVHRHSHFPDAHHRHDH